MSVLNAAFVQFVSFMKLQLHLQHFTGVYITVRVPLKIRKEMEPLLPTIK
jgi:hypothetical protein